MDARALAGQPMASLRETKQQLMAPHREARCTGRTRKENEERARLTGGPGEPRGGRRVPRGAGARLLEYVTGRAAPAAGHPGRPSSSPARSRAAAIDGRDRR